MNNFDGNKPLGEFVRDRRESRGMSLSDASLASGLHHSYWSYLEAGKYKNPRPAHLQLVAEVLEVSVEDLYGMAGYEIPKRLPSFRPYLRAKYDLPPEAISDLERYFDLLRNHFGIPKDKPVFPPKKAPTPGPSEAKKGAA
jgi:transcriptional regulator with XRE-family HTH domain